MVFIDRSDRFLVVVGTAPVHFSMQGTPSGRIKVFILCKAINALFKIFSSRSFILPPQWLSKARHERIKKIGKKTGMAPPFYLATAAPLNRNRMHLPTGERKELGQPSTKEYRTLPV
ncbi:hypothetical protein KY284_037402 [Solanum tuberosum]|nr:hypothetical protein KY284_037402 [Solanum tuberosum]